MSKGKHEVAMLGGGCFWCTEAAFDELRGVEKVEPGYAGGSVPNPTYKQVCSGSTGHAEVVQVSFDPDAITYRDLLDVFFTVHDPTTLNRQGADVGTQYRSVVFYHDEEQKHAAEEAIEVLEASKVWNDPIVTEVSPAPTFFPAEEYHRDYYRRNPGQGYCQVVITPKLAKLRKAHFERLKDNDAGDRPTGEGQVRPYQTEPRNPIDQGGIAE
ncbi:MAG: peptide-methionine (S)-S-oxide reductase MsrA [Gemmatimonas sp.]|nr:peptide-methionine (S)-S-oxide reductase MsrA [Gemmatimonas sp.]